MVVYPISFVRERTWQQGIMSGRRTMLRTVLYVGSIVAFLSVTSCWNLRIAALTLLMCSGKMTTNPPFIDQVRMCESRKTTNSYPDMALWMCFENKFGHDTLSQIRSWKRKSRWETAYKVVKTSLRMNSARHREHAIMVIWYHLPSDQTRDLHLGEWRFEWFRPEVRARMIRYYQS